MKKSRIIVVVSAFVFAIASAFVSDAKKTNVFVSQGYEKTNCSAGLQNVDGGFTCTGTTTTCKINAHDAYSSSTNCTNGGSAGLLKHD
jgi:hypothetical protein